MRRWFNKDNGETNVLTVGFALTGLMLLFNTINDSQTFKEKPDLETTAQVLMIRQHPDLLVSKVFHSWKGRNIVDIMGKVPMQCYKLDDYEGVTTYQYFGYTSWDRKWVIKVYTEKKTNKIIEVVAKGEPPEDIVSLLDKG